MILPCFSRCSVGFVFAFAVFVAVPSWAVEQPNIVLVMADDQGWGEVGYRNHPVLKTPHLDEMAAAGLRLDRFYSGAPVCSPTRASVLTGRSNFRTGVEAHGFALRLQEKTVAQALQAVGYRTGHFGKWHLNGLRGPGVPVLASDDHNPGAFGFERWLSVTNFFDRNPILSRQGEFEEFQGDSSEIVVAQALEFIREQAEQGIPFFTVIWFGTPHSPFVAADQDRRAFQELDAQSQHHYGELVAMDRSIGNLRKTLRDMGIAQHTLVWYCSDNGGLPNITPETVGGLRDFKGSLYEGGLRVPAIVEWPSAIAPRVSEFPAVTMDIFPTLAEIVGLPMQAMLAPQDGISLRQLFDAELGERRQPIMFNCFGETALLHNNWKLLRVGRDDQREQRYELYNLSVDPTESENLLTQQTAIAERLTRQMLDWEQELAKSIAGEDYPEGHVRAGEPSPKYWTEIEAYRPYFEEWKKRPEYRSQLR